MHSPFWMIFIDQIPAALSQLPDSLSVVLDGVLKHGVFLHHVARSHLVLGTVLSHHVQFLFAHPGLCLSRVEIVLQNTQKTVQFWARQHRIIGITCYIQFLFTHLSRVEIVLQNTPKTLQFWARAHTNIYYELYIFGVSVKNSVTGETLNTAQILQKIQGPSPFQQGAYEKPKCLSKLSVTNTSINQCQLK